MRSPALHNLPLARAAAASLLFLLGCPKAEEKKAPPPAEVKKPIEAEKPAAPTAPTGSSDAECIGPYSATGTLTKLDMGGRSFELMGAKLTETTPDADDETTLGVLANIKEDTPDNLKNLAALLELFKADKVEAIVIDGDLGETEAQIANVLEPVAALGLPTFAIIGNREGKAKFNNAVKAVQAKHSNVVNLNAVRLVVLDDVALVSMPGYHDKTYIHDPAGCAYTAQDVEALAPIIKAAGDKPVVLVSHGGPKQDGPEALDRTLEQVNVGDPNLTRLIQGTGVKLGVFANVQEAGARATDLTGTKLIAEGKLADELFFNPGAVDSVRWTMNDRTESVGMAGVLKVKGRQASFKMHRLPAAADKK